MKKLSVYLVLAVILALVPGLSALANSSSGYCVDISGPIWITVPYNGCTYASWTANPNLYTSIYQWSGLLSGTSRTVGGYFCSYNPGTTVISTRSLSVFAQTFSGGVSDTDTITVYIEYQGANCDFLCPE